ncbi:T-complex protein 1 subunit gamma [Dufourea novaeangliae]|uniref:T-complex protein 1 subunit gamma n=1 Tax=Dufourea novaeangliae TaxID=178035 RepID=A0A154P0N0_DUFNO|nr:T-complex protein 1 subunit gamma [Dufourea novaeangliae]
MMEDDWKKPKAAAERDVMIQRARIAKTLAKFCYVVVVLLTFTVIFLQKLDTVYIIKLEENGTKGIDTKHCEKVEEILSGTVEDTTVLIGVTIKKNVSHQKAKRYIQDPGIVLLACPLEYKKGEWRSSGNGKIKTFDRESNSAGVEQWPCNAVAQALEEFCRGMMKSTPLKN